MVVWKVGDPPEHVPVGDFGERALAFIGSEDPAVVLHWAERNRLALREFWGLSKDTALTLKAALDEKATARQEAPHATAAAPAGEGEQMPLLPDAEPDDSEIVLRDLIAEVSKEPDAKKRRAIWENSAKACETMTDAQVARLKAALDQMELRAGKPRGKAAA